MPHSASAKKRHRQNLRNRDRNRAAKSVLKADVRKALDAIESGDTDRAREALRALASTADKAASSHTIHRNKAARIKSRLSARMLAVVKAGGSPAKSAGKSSGKGRSSASKSKA